MDMIYSNDGGNAVTCGQ